MSDVLPATERTSLLRHQEIILHSPFGVGLATIREEEDGLEQSPTERVVPPGDDVLTNVRYWVQSRLDHNEEEDEEFPRDATGNTLMPSMNQKQPIFKFGETKNLGRAFTFTAPNSLEEPETRQDILSDTSDTWGL